MDCENCGCNPCECLNQVSPSLNDTFNAIESSERGYTYPQAYDYDDYNTKERDENPENIDY